MRVESFSPEVKQEFEDLINEALAKQLNQIISPAEAAKILGIFLPKLNEQVLKGELTAYTYSENKPVFKKGELLTKQYNLPVWGQKSIFKDSDKFKN